MNIGIYLYNGYDETEVCIPAFLFRKENIITISSDDEFVKCMDGRKIVSDKRVNEVNPDNIDVLIIPGGMPIIKDDILELIIECEKRNVIIGGICGGVDFLAQAGVLADRKFTGYYEENKEYGFLPQNGKLTYSMYETDRNIVSAKPEAYLEFAMEVYHLTGKEIESVDGYVEWFKSPFVWKK